MKIRSGALSLLLSIALTSESVSAFGVAPNSRVQSSSSFVSRTPSIIHNARSQCALASMATSSSTRSPQNNKSAGMTMFGGAESGGITELKELTKAADASNPIVKTFRKQPTLLKISGYAAVPASFILGAVITPSRRAAATAVGSAITGVAGLIGKNRLDAATEAAAMPGIAQVIIDKGLDDPETPSLIAEVQETFGVQDEDFADMCSDIYKVYITGMIKTPITKTSELKELSSLRTVLKMDNLRVGEAHTKAAKDFSRQTSLFTPVEDLEDPDHPDRMSIDKFLFFSERIFHQGGETEEAFKYEMSRVAKAFDLSLRTAMDRVAEVAEPFYDRALQSARSKIDTGAVSADMLERARNTLGIDDSVARDMHIATFAEEVRSLLGKKSNDDDESEDSAEEVDEATMKFSDNAKEKLDLLAEVLNLETKDADYEISVEASPLFQAKALASMNDSIAGTISPDQAWSDMEARQKELLFNDDAMKDLLASLVMQTMGQPLEATMTFAKVNNEGATYDKLLEALEAKEAIISVLKNSDWEEFNDFEAKFFDPKSKSSACGFLEFADRLSLYRVFLKRSVSKSESGEELTEELYAKVKEVQGMLGLSDDDEASEFKKNFGPELQKSLATAMIEIMGDDFTPELVTNLKAISDKIIKDYKLPDSLVSEYAGPNYMRAVNIVNQNTPGGVPTTEQMEQLESLREYLKMTKEDTYTFHLEVFGSAYKSGVLEAMGSTGIIRPELKAPLNDLRDRLGVSEGACKTLFLEAVEEKMKPMVEWIILELERTMLTPKQLADKRQKDFGEDYFKTGKGADGKLGIGAEANIMTDCMNLIDFYCENNIPEKNEVGKKTVEKKVVEGDEEKTVSEEVPVFETTYPVTALGMSAVEPELAELLFRQYVVGGFTTQGKQGERYEAARDTFGGIIGLSKDKMQEITKSIGGTVYENYIGNSMRTKPSLDQQDMMFLANIQGKLGISSEASEKMLLDTQKKILSEEAEVVLNVDTAEAIKTFREKCNSMGMELEADIGLSKDRISRMFETEVTPSLLKGDITIESGDILSEIQDSLGMTPEEAETIFERIIDKRSKNAISTIKAELLRGRDENCVGPIERLVRFSQFVNGELDINVDEAIGWKIYNLYEAMDFSDQDLETVENNKELLKTALKVS
eukprot:CAMPEP_0197831662 /NCGR_PEP_ID=MMETSP1437-20131217/11448_1 /TAXON_ID=49252 ORGANISM="Eucampia antarctica, Strain CCMP1452" /NCGR_SAMPLE_ID=MMETSP1437 /ASSEMBLY_ACC=CAM_ASM_001096 /LENGTH=1154 /DNA_ID=CAMNT_0043434679 /DNA_START=92 /DNA_END=3556 /DNA_ORIENTATION=+